METVSTRSPNTSNPCLHGPLTQCYWQESTISNRGKTPKDLASNPITRVREVTNLTFAIYGPSHHYVDAMKELQRLSRVSFPFSALILAEYDPINFPYFAEGVYTRRGCASRDMEQEGRLHIQAVPHPNRARTQLRGRLKEESGMDVTALEAEKVGRWIIEAALKRRKPTLDSGEDDLLLRSTGNMVA